jgi:hypothetical protein
VLQRVVSKTHNVPYGAVWMDRVFCLIVGRKLSSCRAKPQWHQSLQKYARTRSRLRRVPDAETAVLLMGGRFWWTPTKTR